MRTTFPGAAGLACLMMLTCLLQGCLMSADQTIGTREVDAPMRPGAYLTCDVDGGEEACRITRVKKEGAGAVSFEQSVAADGLTPLGALFAATSDPNRFLADLPIDEGRKFVRAIVQREPNGLIAFLPDCLKLYTTGIRDTYQRRGQIDSECNAGSGRRTRQFMTELAGLPFDTLVNVSLTFRLTPVSEQWAVEFDQAEAELLRGAQDERERTLDIATTVIREFNGAFPALTRIVTQRRINYGAPILGVMYSQRIDVDDIACGPVAGTRVICRWRQSVETTAANELYSLMVGKTPLLRDETLEMMFEFIDKRWASPELRAHLKSREPRSVSVPSYETLDATKPLRDGLCASLPFMSGTGQDFVRAGSNCM